MSLPSADSSEGLLFIVGAESETLRVAALLTRLSPLFRCCTQLDSRVSTRRRLLRLREQTTCFRHCISLLTAAHAASSS